MECRIYRNSDLFDIDKPCKRAYQKENDKNWYIKLENIEELKALNKEVSKEVKCPLIFHHLNAEDWGTDWEIEIHDKNNECNRF